MSAEAWRRIGSDLAPLDLAGQAWHFQHLRLDLRGRRGAFGTSISAEAWRRIGSDLAPLDLVWQA